MGTDSDLPNHASVILGWGEEKGEKYWILRNTFGKEYGLNGNLNVKRGDFMVQNNIVGFEPVRM